VPFDDDPGDAVTCGYGNCSCVFDQVGGAWTADVSTCVRHAMLSDEEVEGNLSFPFGKNGASEKCCNCAADSLTAKKEQRKKRQAALDQKRLKWRHGVASDFTRPLPKLPLEEFTAYFYQVYLKEYRKDL
jgi:hypothetical protein